MASGILKAIGSGLFNRRDGYKTESTGKGSSVDGIGTKAIADGQSVVGAYNTPNADALFIVGNGTSDKDRHNAFMIMKNGAIRSEETGLLPIAVDLSGYVSAIFDSTNILHYDLELGAGEGLSMKHLYRYILEHYTDAACQHIALKMCKDLYRLLYDIAPSPVIFYNNQKPIYAEGTPSYAKDLFIETHEVLHGTCTKFNDIGGNTASYTKGLSVAIGPSVSFSGFAIKVYLVDADKANPAWQYSFGGILFSDTEGPFGE